MARSCIKWTLSLLKVGPLRSVIGSLMPGMGHVMPEMGLLWPLMAPQAFLGLRSPPNWALAILRRAPLWIKETNFRPFTGPLKTGKACIIVKL